MEISSRRDLAKALRSSDACARQALLQSLDRAFGAAQAQGRQINAEAIDELYLCYREDGIDRTWYAYLLLRLNNKYSVEVARKEFAAGRNNKLLLLAATHLARLPQAERIDFLSPMVLDPANAARCRAAANLLDDCFARLEAHVALRAALISDHDLPLPAPSPATLGIWCVELGGPYPDSAKKALLRSGDAALELLLAHWTELSAGLRIWLLRTATERKLAAVEAKLREIVRAGCDGAQLVVALECLRTLGIGDEALVAPLYDHADASVRAAAIVLGRAEIDWAQRLAAEPSEHVRGAMVERIARSGDGGQVALLARCLKDSSWRVRARATDALVALAPASLAVLRQALGDAEERVKVAAAQGLYRLGKQEWIGGDLPAATCCRP